MANGRNKSKKGDAGRDAGGFVAIPWAVLDSPAYARLSHPAKALLMEFARQFVRDNNGKLLCSMAHLRERGWKSADVVQRAKVELLGAGFIFETYKGHRPNRASWYAVTWRTLDKHGGYDSGTAESFERGAYRKNTLLIPSPGIEKARIVPSPGIEKALPVPSPGTMGGSFARLSIPSPGNHLEKPSAGSFQDGVKEGERNGADMHEGKKSLPRVRSGPSHPAMLVEALRDGPKTTAELLQLGIYNVQDCLLRLRKRGYSFAAERVPGELMKRYALTNEPAPSTT